MVAWIVTHATRTLVCFGIQVCHFAASHRAFLTPHLQTTPVMNKTLMVFFCTAAGVRGLHGLLCAAARPAQPAVPGGERLLPTAACFMVPVSVAWWLRVEAEQHGAASCAERSVMLGWTAWGRGTLLGCRGTWLDSVAKLHITVVRVPVCLSAFIARLKASRQFSCPAGAGRSVAPCWRSTG